MAACKQSCRVCLFQLPSTALYHEASAFRPGFSFWFVFAVRLPLMRLFLKLAFNSKYVVRFFFCDVWKGSVSKEFMYFISFGTCLRFSCGISGMASHQLQRLNIFVFKWADDRTSIRFCLLETSYETPCKRNVDIK